MTPSCSGIRVTSGMWIELSVGVGCLEATIVSRVAGVNAARAPHALRGASAPRFVDTRVAAS